MPREISIFLSHLPTYRGYPIPFVQCILPSGIPDFKAIDSDRVWQCVEDRLCAICGRELLDVAVFIGGNLCIENRLFTDPPMHPDCVRFTAKTCPFVSGEHRQYSELPKKPGQFEHEGVAKGRMGKMYAMKARPEETRFVLVHGDLLIRAGKWLAEPQEIGLEIPSS